MWKVYMEYLYNVHFFLTEKLCGMEIFLSACFWWFSLASNMSGIVNSSQYCYFNSLVQCLSNTARVQQLLEEHTQTLEEGEGMKCRFY